MIAYGHEPSALDPFAGPPAPRPARHESMAGHPAGAMRGVLTGLALAAPLWALVGGLIWWVVAK